MPESAYIIRSYRDTEYLNKRNNLYFSDEDWTNFFSNKIANKNWHIKEKTRLIQESACIDTRLSDGSLKKY